MQIYALIQKAQNLSGKKLRPNYRNFAAQLGSTVGLFTFCLPFALRISCLFLKIAVTLQG